MQIRKNYFIAAILIFLIEVGIAKYVHDAIVRPFVGDFLVVILLYLIVRAISKSSCLQAALGVLIFSFAVESLQWIGIVDILGLSDNKFAKILLGTTFSLLDLVSYILGTVTIYFIDEKLIQ